MRIVFLASSKVLSVVSVVNIRYRIRSMMYAKTQTLDFRWKFMSWLKLNILKFKNIYVFVIKGN